MTRDEMQAKLESVLTPKRFIHSVNVMNMAVKLAQNYKEDEEKAAIAGLLHDCARDTRGEEALSQCSRYGVDIDAISRVQTELLHGPLGAKIARCEYGITDEAVLRAIYWHTTGHENMDMLEKIVFIADYIEPGRNFPGVNEARKAAFIDMDKAMIMSLDSTIRHVISKGVLIHPDTIGARNFIIAKYPRGKFWA